MERVYPHVNPTPEPKCKYNSDDTPNELFLYFDPLHKLSTEAQEQWNDPTQRENMVNHAIHSVDLKLTDRERKKISKRLEASFHQPK